MGFQLDTQELKRGLVIFRRTDVKHPRWYCRVKLPNQRRYKTIALSTTRPDEAREQAFSHEAEINFRIKHGVPVFDKTFAQVADEFSAFQKERSEAGEITFHRWRVMHSHIKTQLKPYVGATEITLLGEERWKGYPMWRQKNGEGRSGGRVSDGTIRDEMTTFRAIMSYAASKSTSGAIRSLERGWRSAKRGGRNSRRPISAAPSFCPAVDRAGAECARHLVSHDGV